MDYNTPGRSPVFCDWLDGTFPEDSPAIGELAMFLSGLGASARRVTPDRVEYRLPGAVWGNILLETSQKGWSRASASGGSCEALRAISSFDDYLRILSDHPFNVTRLDATLDLLLPSSPIITELSTRYPLHSPVNLTRKGVPAGHLLQRLPDGSLTGTFNAGDLRSRARVLGRVYDKQAQVLKHRGEVIGPRTRYEIVLRKYPGVTLRDVCAPAPVFWHFASPALLNAPPCVPIWEPFAGDGWSLGKLPPVDLVRRLQRVVESSVDLENMLLLANELPGDGAAYLLRLLQNRVGLRDLGKQNVVSA
jgi:hypothetical protein